MVNLGQSVIVLTIAALAVSTEAFLLTAGSMDLSLCPRNLHRDKHLFAYSNKCLQFVIGHHDSWPKAQQDCFRRGGRLVEIHSAGKQAFIQYALSVIGFSSHGLWIGLSDIQTEHRFVWTSGSVLRGYSNWGPGEDANNIFHFPQDCIYMNQEQHGTWWDMTCDLWPNFYDWICEYDKLDPPKTTRKRTTATTSTTTSTTSTTTTTTTARPKTTTMPTTTTTASCDVVDCLKKCPGGYSGLSVDSDGCVACLCT